MTLLGFLAGKSEPVSYAQMSSLLKAGCPSTLPTSWLTRPTRQFNLGEVLDFLSSPRPYKVPSRQGSRVATRPGHTFDEAAIREALAHALGIVPQLEEGEYPDFPPAPDSSPYGNEETSESTEGVLD
jgi:hypothetical protein